MFKPKISIASNIHEKIRMAAENLGCSIEEFASKTLETEADRVISQSGAAGPSTADVEDIANKLKGLGYLE